MAGIAANIAGISFTALYLIGDGVLDISESNNNNSSSQSVTLTFTCLSDYKPGRHVFLVQTVAGAKWLIGGKSAVPSIKTTDTTAGAGTKNACEVTIELSAPVAAQRVIGQESIITEGGYVAFQDWRQVADATYAQKVHRHDTDEVDDDPFGKNQEQVNQDLYDLAAAGIVM